MAEARAVVDDDDSHEWEGFERKRWSTRYAALFIALFVPMVVLLFDIVDMSGRGRQVGGIIIAVFVVTVLAGGLFLAKMLAWRLDRRQRQIAMLTTLVLGAALWLGLLHRSWPHLTWRVDGWLDRRSSFERPPRVLFER